MYLHALSVYFQWLVWGLFGLIILYLVPQEKSSPCTGPVWWVLQLYWHFRSLSCDSFHANLVNGSDSTLPLTSLATSTWITLAWPLHEPLAGRSYLRLCHLRPNWHSISHNSFPEGWNIGKACYREYRYWPKFRFCIMQKLAPLKFPLQWMQWIRMTENHVLMTHVRRTFAHHYQSFSMLLIWYQLNHNHIA